LAIGDPPKDMVADEIAIWHEIIFINPPGVLTSSDLMVVEVLARLFAKFRRRENLNGPEWSRMCGSLSLLGMTPADRSRVTSTESTPDNPFSEFTQ
jgi:hypothetical protein